MAGPKSRNPTMMKVVGSQMEGNAIALRLEDEDQDVHTVRVDPRVAIAMALELFRAFPKGTAIETQAMYLVGADPLAAESGDRGIKLQFHNGVAMILQFEDPEGPRVLKHAIESLEGSFPSQTH